MGSLNGSQERGPTGKPDDLHAVPHTCNMSPEVAYGSEHTLATRSFPQDPYVHDSQPTPGQRTVCGLRAGYLWLLLALVVVIIAAAVGGGVGGTLSVKRCRDDLDTCSNEYLALRNESARCNSQLNQPQLNSTDFPSADNGSATCENQLKQYQPNSTGCPSTGIDPPPDAPIYKTTSTKTQYTFSKQCNTNWVHGDVAAAVVTSWERCMDACATVNNYGAAKCKGLTFIPSWIEAAAAIRHIGFWANCFLKENLTELGDATRFEAVAASVVFPPV